jgi:hypothetical protein
LIRPLLALLHRIKKYFSFRKRYYKNIFGDGAKPDDKEKRALRVRRRKEKEILYSID